MNKLSFMDKLLDRVAVEWIALGKVVTLRRGRVMSKQYLADNIGKYPVFSSQTANNGIIGSISTFDFDGEYISWTTDGANAGTIFYQKGKFSITNVCGLIKINDKVKLIYKFLYYWLSIEAQKHVYAGMGNPKLMSHQVEKILIPIPCPDNPKKSLAIQTEIVRILDAFTALTSELTSELKLRKQQYQYYRDKLLSFDENEVEWKTLRDVCEMKAGQYISSNEISLENDILHIFPCYGGNGIRGFVSRKNQSGKHLIIGRQGALCGNVQRFSGDFYATEHAVVVSNKINIDIDWLFHYLTKMNLNQYASQSAQPGLAVGKILNLKIPIVPLLTQQKIAAILDKFDTLTNSITEGLPHEIELRQKQYEYYRDQLFNFPKHKEIEV